MPRNLRFKPKHTSTFKPKTFNPLKDREIQTHSIRREGIQASYELAENRLNHEFYQSIEWKKLSDEFRTNNPFCFACGKSEGRMYVDHIIEISTDEGWEKRLDPMNLQILCPSHHAIKTNQERKKRVEYGMKPKNFAPYKGKKKFDGDICC